MGLQHPPELRAQGTGHGTISLAALDPGLQPELATSAEFTEIKCRMELNDQ